MESANVRQGSSVKSARNPAILDTTAQIALKSVLARMAPNVPRKRVNVSANQAGTESPAIVLVMKDSMGISAAGSACVRTERPVTPRLAPVSVPLVTAETFASHNARSSLTEAVALTSVLVM